MINPRRDCGGLLMGRLTEYFGKGTSVSAEVDKGAAYGQLRALSRLMIDNPQTKREVKKIFSKEIRAAARRTQKDVRNNLGNDPRQAFRAVKSAVYKRILGGNISDLASTRAVTKMSIWRKDRKLDMNPRQRGGNRRKRSARTNQLDGYIGKDRGFVLRFLNAGTDERRVNYGLRARRGSIRTHRVFEVPAIFQMDEASELISAGMTNKLVESYNKELK